LSKLGPAVEYDLGENGGLFRFRTFRQFQHAAAAERKEWEWLTRLPSGGILAQTPSRVQEQLIGIENWAGSIADRGSVGGEDILGVLLGHYGGGSPELYHSRGKTGEALLLLRGHSGDQMAAVAYGILIGLIQPDLRNLMHVRAMTLVANPILIPPDQRRLAARERLDAVFKYGEELNGEQAALFERSGEEWAAFQREASKRGKRLLVSSLKHNRAMRENTEAQAQAAIASIKSTEAAYGAQMELDAAVNYWGGKKGQHSTQRDAAFGNLTKFIWRGGIAAGAAFFVAIWLLLEMAGVNLPFIDLGRGPDAAPLPAVSYLIITLALGTLLTCLFWAARIFVRIYLSERTLITDSEERVVMIKTYLALIKEGGALNNEDRLVILNALFRSAGDGSSGQESGGEVALPALMARLIDQRSNG
jgi:Family of unknown function (DUF6161)